MKVIYPNNAESITSTSEHANYPDDNLLDEHPKKVWKANDVVSASVSIIVVGGGDGFAVFNTNALSVAIIISGVLNFSWDTDWSWDTGWSWASSSDIETDIETFVTIDQDDYGVLWVEHEYIASPYTVALTFDSETTETVYAGLFVGGTINNYPGPLFGVDENLVDYSITRELSNGSTYFRKRDVVRNFGVNSVLEDSATEYYSLLRGILQKIGPQPVAWRIVYGENNTNENWIVYGQGKVAKGRHLYPIHNHLSFQILEVL